jgi:hypothetical protein
MRRTNKKFRNLKTLPNIQNLEVIRQQLEQTEFQDDGHNLFKQIHLKQEQPVHTFSQLLPKETEKLNLQKVKQRIQEQQLEGYIISTAILEDVLAQHPLPVSAQKQAVLEYVCRMNNGPHNQAENIHIVYEHNHELEPILNNKIQSTLAPNLASQIISTIHRHRKSRLTVGEAHNIDSIVNQIPDGDTVLQISHLTYHALDLDLSLSVHKDEIGKSRKLTGPVSVFETCISLPYSLKDKHFSKHGYILHLKGDQITPEKIAKIIGLKKTGFGGTIVANGTMFTNVLSIDKPKLFRKGHNFKHQTVVKESELIGAFNYDPNLKLLSKGYCNLEKAGHLESMSGEITLAFFPSFQTYIGEYK